MAMIHVVSFVVYVTGATCLKSTKNTVRITGDWWNPCRTNENYDLCPRYQCVAESCLHFLGLLKCHDRGNNMPCRAECRCKKYFFRNRDGKCIPQHDCVPAICGPNEIFNKCHPCNYAQKSLKCPNANPDCKPGCYCKAGYIRDIFGECVEDKRIKLPVTKAPGCFTTMSTTTMKPYNEDLSDEQYNMIVLPRPEKPEDKEQSAISNDISQTSFKILPINIQLQFDKNSNTSRITYQSNKDTTEPIQKNNDNISSTVYVYKYLSLNNSQITIPENKKLTTITIDTMDDEGDLRVTKPTDDIHVKTKTQNEPNFYKYISVSVMQNYNKTNSTHDINDMFHDFDDLSDIQVTATTSHTEIVIFSSKKSANDSSIMSSFTTEMYSEPDRNISTTSEKSKLENYEGNHSIVFDDLVKKANASQLDDNFYGSFTPILSLTSNLATLNSTQLDNNGTSEFKNKTETTTDLNIAYTPKINLTTDLKITLIKNDTVFIESKNFATTQIDGEYIESTVNTSVNDLDFKKYFNNITQDVLSHKTLLTTEQQNVTTPMKYLSDLVNTTKHLSVTNETSTYYQTDIVTSVYLDQNSNHISNHSEKKYNVRLKNTSKVPTKGLNYIW